MKTPGDGDAVYTVDAVYGGGVKKQRYMTKMTAPDGGFFYAILPIAVPARRERELPSDVHRVARL